MKGISEKSLLQLVWKPQQVTLITSRTDIVCLELNCVVERGGRGEGKAAVRAYATVRTYRDDKPHPRTERDGTLLVNCRWA
jgi:hypothetical protein